MRASILIVLPALCGCMAAAEPFGALLGADVASVAVFGRSLGDLGASALTGRDCSIVRLDRGQSYCADRNAPMREAYCTRTLATVDCWATAPPDRRPQIADTPPATAAQERYRAAPWPKALTANP